ncbi:MAG: hypothetical protein Q8L24_00240, partial [bacterium]|nr:hypothetical protein [bacterium]
MNLKSILLIIITFATIGLVVTGGVYFLSQTKTAPSVILPEPADVSVPPTKPSAITPPSSVVAGKPKTPISKPAIAAKSDLFGVMLAYNANDGLMASRLFDELQKGWSIFKKDQQAALSYLNSLRQVYGERDGLVGKTGFSSDREMAALFTWNVLEPEKGTFDWTLTDLAAQHAKVAGVKFSAVIQPYASWDQIDTQPISNCRMLDSAWTDYKVGPVIKDTAEYENFLTKIVERYKGDVASWEIGNEPDAQCSGFQNNPEDYLKL